MSPVRALLLTPIFVAVVAIGAVVWMLSTEITQSNAEVQVSRLCLTSNIAISIDRMTGLSGLKPPRYDCNCAAKSLGVMFPSEKGAKLAEATRRLLVDRFKAALIRSTPPTPDIDGAALREIRRYFDRIGSECSMTG